MDFQALIELVWEIVNIISKISDVLLRWKRIRAQKPKQKRKYRRKDQAETLKPNKTSRTKRKL